MLSHKKSEKNIDMAEIMYYGKKSVEMRRIYFIFLNFRIRIYGKIRMMIRENGIRKADDKKIYGVSVMSQTASDV
jgi:hypothetical protein